MSLIICMALAAEEANLVTKGKMLSFLSLFFWLKFRGSVTKVKFNFVVFDES